LFASPVVLHLNASDIVCVCELILLYLDDCRCARSLVRTGVKPTSWMSRQACGIDSHHPLLSHASWLVSVLLFLLCRHHVSQRGFAAHAVQQPRASGEFLGRGFGATFANVYLTFWAAGCAATYSRKVYTKCLFKHTHSCMLTWALTTRA